MRRLPMEGEKQAWLFSVAMAAEAKPHARVATGPFAGLRHLCNTLLTPGFDDPCAEESYRSFAGRGGEAGQRVFALAISGCGIALWAHHLALPLGLDRQARASLGLMGCEPSC